MTPEEEQDLKRLLQWQYEAQELYPIHPKALGELSRMHLRRQGYLAARLKAHQEQSARIQELEGLLREAMEYVPITLDGFVDMSAVNLKNRITATLSGGGGTTTTQLLK